MVLENSATPARPHGGEVKIEHKHMFTPRANSQSNVCTLLRHFEYNIQMWPSLQPNNQYLILYLIEKIKIGFKYFINLRLNYGKCTFCIWILKENRAISSYFLANTCKMLSFSDIQLSKSALILPVVMFRRTFFKAYVMFLLIMNLCQFRQHLFGTMPSDVFQNVNSVCLSCSFLHLIGCREVYVPQLCFGLLTAVYCVARMFLTFVVHSRAY